VLVVHPFENAWKGVRTALEAIQELRRRGLDLVLVRLSQWPLSDTGRALVEPDEYHEHLSPERVPALMAGCDLLLAPSWEQEGFGLPVLEAMAAGVPVVASNIPAFRDFAAGAALLVPPEDVRAFADAAEHVLRDPGRWRTMRRAGLDVAGRFNEKAAADAAEAALRWVAEGRWRTEP
jgi:glycosyltransferase involved in cell wall biosynthesis